VIVGLKSFLKNSKVTSDKQMLTVIFDLVHKVMANVELFDEQMNLINLVNNYIVNVDILDNEHLQKIVKINTILHQNNKERYENSVEAEFVNFQIRLVTSKARSAEMTNLMAAFITSLSKLKTKPFEIKDIQAEMMINGTVFDVKTRLNIIKNFAKLQNNLTVYLRHHLIEFLIATLTSDDQVIRTRSLEVLRHLLETAEKKADVKSSLREVCLRHPDVQIYDYCIKYLESITSVSRPSNTSPELDTEIAHMLKIISLERSLKDFQDIFIEIQNVEGYIKSLSDKSSSKDIRLIFSLIYNQMYKNWNNDQRPDILDAQKLAGDSKMSADRDVVNGGDVGDGEEDGEEEEDGDDY
jgi:hypothetical protein